MMHSICLWEEVLKHNQSLTTITSMLIKTRNGRSLLNQLKSSKMTSIQATSLYQCTANSQSRPPSTSSSNSPHLSNNSPLRSTNRRPPSSSLTPLSAVQLPPIASTSNLKMIWMRKNAPESSKQIRTTSRDKECSMRNRKRRTPSSSRDAPRARKP